MCELNILCYTALDRFQKYQIGLYIRLLNKYPYLVHSSSVNLPTIYNTIHDVYQTKNKGRNFYAPGGEYHIFAGRDATRLLAKTIVEEETEEQLAKPLNMAERAALQGWMWTFDSKYEVVGKLKDFDPKSTSTRAID